MDRMYAYNEGLLALGKLSPEFEDGQKALDELTEFCRNATAPSARRAS